MFFPLEMGTQVSYTHKITGSIIVMCTCSGHQCFGETTVSSRRMGAVFSSQTLVTIHNTTRSDNPEDHHWHPCRENIKCSKVKITVLQISMFKETSRTALSLPEHHLGPSDVKLWQYLASEDSQVYSIQRTNTHNARILRGGGAAGKEAAKRVVYSPCWVQVDEDR